VEHRAVDAADADALATATAGAVAVYNAVDPAYDRWATDWPPVAAALLAAAQRSDAVLVMMGNLYGYGRPSGVMTPESPLAATDTKGRVRARMWADALAALGSDERAWGHAWHVPSAIRSQREALTDLASALGAGLPKVSGIPWPALRAVGLVVPFMREVVDVRHQFDQPYVTDAARDDSDLRADRDALGRRRPGQRRCGGCRALRARIP
jgi:hypothetical protein